MKTPRYLFFRYVIVLTAAWAVVGLSAGCDPTGQEFRTVAGPSFEAGVTAIANGIIDGAFAAYMPDDEDNNSASSTSSDEST